MRIAVNTRLLIKNKLEGIGWFTFETFSRMVQEHPEHEFLFLFDRPYDPAFIFAGNVTPVQVGPQTRHPVLWYLWFEYQLPRIFKKYKVDLFVSPDGYLSLKSPVPQLDVIHDINFAHRPKDLPLKFRTYYNYFFPKYARKARRIATVSEYSKNDIASTYGILPEKIDVVYNGANLSYTPIDERKKNETRQQFTSGKEYFLFVGAMHPRKNIPFLLQAFDEFKKQSSSDIKLVLVGEKMFLTASISETLNKMQFKQDVVFTGRMEPEVLSMLMGSALALTFIPLFEGFGIPVIEAFQAGIPVIASKRTSLPEVCGDAALMVNPTDLSEIAGAMNAIYRDDKLRSELVRKGSIQKMKFSWDKTAGKFWESIEKCLQTIH